MLYNIFRLLTIELQLNTKLDFINNYFNIWLTRNILHIILRSNLLIFLLDIYLIITFILLVLIFWVTKCLLFYRFAQYLLLLRNSFQFLRPTSLPFLCLFNIIILLLIRVLLSVWFIIRCYHLILLYYHLFIKFSVRKYIL